eukprot:CAMPEP_0119129972 /NCGR_PEP_ID=MMETSP1310-20130426/7499_1 /TAXON_ID=464262 /ORGANISM="Genus nov. species nov., Strain RCC2339" /LENGTH=946 /DNA_ID=CAMNT_0007120435 /DNA_START=107 /DNA_END=2947 /DNA_ORIENTATION=+
MARGKHSVKRRKLEDDVEENSGGSSSDEYEEEVGKRKRGGGPVAVSSSKKGKNDSLSMFFEDEAAVGDESEDYEEDSDGDLPSDEEQQALSAARELATHRRTFRDMDDDDVSKLAKEIEERHKAGVYGALAAGGDTSANREQLTSQRSRMPDVRRDPPMWLVKCRPGKEREVLVGLMSRYYSRRRTNQPVQIYSAVAPDHLKGYIYIEAAKEQHVRKACLLFRGTLFSYGLKLVPVTEKKDILRVNAQGDLLQPHSWVRVKRGTYKQDLGQVLAYDENRQQAVVKLVPRLNMQDMAARQNRRDGEPPNRRKGQRPQAKFFNRKDARDAGLSAESRFEQGNNIIVCNSMKFMDGFLLKTMNIKSLIIDDVVPTFSELQKFQRTDENGELVGALPAMVKRQVTFVKGDTVIVFDGALKNLMGVVKNVDGDTVTVQPQNVKLEETVKVLARDLQKYFRVGDHVKVISGRHSGETGMVLEVDGNVLVLHTDSTKEEIKLLSQDVQISSEVSSGQMSMGGISLHDMVQVSQTVAGVVIKVERDGFQVLTSENAVKHVKLHEIRRKINDRSTFAYDRRHEALSVGDAVKVVDGKATGKSGTVKHIYRYFVFLQIPDRIEQSGILLCRANQCNMVGIRDDDSGNSRFGAMSPGALSMKNDRAQMMYSQTGRGRGADPLLNQRIRITRGPYKGYIGIVKSTTDSTARIELHAVYKFVTINKEHLKQIDEAGSVRRQVGDSAFPDDLVPQTPSRAPDTPMRTPFAPGTPFGPGTPRGETPYTPTPGTPMDSVWDPSAQSTSGPEPHTADYTGANDTPRSATAYETWTARTATAEGMDTAVTPRFQSTSNTPFTSTFDNPPSFGQTSYNSAQESLAARTPRLDDPGTALPPTPGGPPSLSRSGDVGPWVQHGAVVYHAGMRVVVRRVNEDGTAIVSPPDRPGAEQVVSASTLVPAS